MVAAATILVVAENASAQAAASPGTEKFGLTPKQLVQTIEMVEAAIAKCMRSEGFQYIAVDYKTARRGMSADKRILG
jgi:hypothetical protein